MTTLEILKAGRALIADPARWTQNVIAVGTDGHWCDPASSDAVSFCSAGALERCAIYGDTWEANFALKAEMGSDYISKYNDTHSHAEVMAAWDRAIEGLQERGAQQGDCHDSVGT